jgi:hypothetical protein
VFSTWSVPKVYKREFSQQLAVVKLTTVQVTRRPLQHKKCKMGMICPAKPVLTEDLCVVQKQTIFL